MKTSWQCALSNKRSKCIMTQINTMHDTVRDLQKAFTVFSDIFIVFWTL